MRQTRPQRRSLTTAFGAVVDWLIEPAEAPALDYADDSVPGRADHAPPTAPRLEVRPVVAVVGLARRCGATSVARGLGAALAARDPSGACAVTAASGTGGIRLGLPAAGRLARLLAPVGEVNACGRLCLVTTDNPVQLCDATRYAAPLVLDVGQGLETSAAAALADMVLIVCAPSDGARASPGGRGEPEPGGADPEGRGQPINRHSPVRGRRHPPARGPHGCAPGCDRP